MFHVHVQPAPFQWLGFAYPASIFCGCSYYIAHHRCIRVWYVPMIWVDYAAAMCLSALVNAAVTSNCFLHALEIHLTFTHLVSPYNSPCTPPYGCQPHSQCILLPSFKESSCFLCWRLGVKLEKWQRHLKKNTRRVIPNYCVSNITLPPLQPSFPSLIYHSR